MSKESVSIDPMRFLVLCLSLFDLTVPATADTLTCYGSDPSWEITLNGETARFRYLERDGTFSIPHQTRAKGDSDSKAYTLIGDTVTAILLTHPAACNTQNVQAHVMTQDKGEAILLSGCCSKPTP